MASSSAAYDVYLKVLSDSTLVSMPSLLDGSGLSTVLNSAIDSVMLGGSAEEAVKEAQDTVADIE